MSKKMVLIIDDEDNIRSGLMLSLKSEGFDVQGAASGVEALDKINLFLPDLIVSDIKMPGLNGLELLEQVKIKHPNIPVIMLTGHAGLDDAVTAMKLGAYDFLTKPVHLDKLILLIQRAIAQMDQHQQLQNLSEQLEKHKDMENIIGSSGCIKKLQEMIRQIAPTDATVLLQGESGVGKEIFASAIHQNSMRSLGPFVKVHCGALPENLLESELFGHEKGAFTGATARRKGRFELANGGTIFLDEIGDISPAVQIKLLRVLQEREFERVGGEETIKTDIRIISATNKNLKQAVQDKIFREDLYYRLNVVELAIPPLRERKEDIPLLVDFFLKNFSNKYNKQIKSFDTEAMKKVLTYSWPGNIRELQNSIETAVVLSKDQEISVHVLPAHLQDL
ncbi:DNA-binding transcriptional response regulator, NtrC family, contains REC, AAA-type ATPase, and a Fis-type DNA-binding domains [Brevinema andersonii]|uniref:DNA-binding transcriptional response regulator, NtrC family, contains REC, AAA-type ATPase, and a Fis-type DNA-binding domains n=1 Tax=Brevinema andersonii TaxID=34097 RepID=A0A1I1CZD6_BREAD|nr:sigma-54 dependent transcriptional regulator [Brevinema andersonii]SFB67894.1 DNA-binding transcriptional response regulator, NtrC family, contains REC, AAA-type ATPase, and a Fis-type DNA-binding domains [Brevinema andersonii]